MTIMSNALVAGGLPSLETLGFVPARAHPNRRQSTPPRPPHSDTHPESVANGLPEGPQTLSTDNQSDGETFAAGSRILRKHLLCRHLRQRKPADGNAKSRVFPLFPRQFEQEHPLHPTPGLNSSRGGCDEAKGAIFSRKK